LQAALKSDPLSIGNKPSSDGEKSDWLRREHQLGSDSKRSDAQAAAISPCSLFGADFRGLIHIV
jgi:hypothetical protein